MTIWSLATRTMLRALPLLLAAGSSSAQLPEKFTNLRVLPRDIGKSQLIGVMRGFSFSVGVRCEHCHAAQPDPKAGLDFASDAKEAKRTARVMMQMVEVINRDHLSRLGKAATVQVECTTCHRGIGVPRTVNAVLAEKLEQKGVPEATALYRELRKKYYGSAAYDFSETPLNILAEALLAKSKAAEAAAMMELNAEVNNPLSGWGLEIIAMAHRASGARDKAIADYQRILELDPKNQRARQQLEELKSGK
jgi:Photosynthetic reaction centre cytochrome C subunit